MPCTTCRRSRPGRRRDATTRIKARHAHTHTHTVEPFLVGPDQCSGVRRGTASFRARRQDGAHGAMHGTGLVHWERELVITIAVLASVSAPSRRTRVRTFLRCFRCMQDASRYPCAHRSCLPASFPVLGAFPKLYRMQRVTMRIRPTQRPTRRLLELLVMQFLLCGLPADPSRNSHIVQPVSRKRVPEQR